MSQSIEQILQALREGARHRRRKPVRRLLLARSGAADTASFLQGLAGGLAQDGRAFIRFTLPRNSLDAGEHILGQLCEGFDIGRLPRASFSPGYPLHKRIAWIARLFDQDKAAPVLLLDIPRGWLVRVWDARRGLPDAPRSILEALLKPGFDAVVVSAEEPRWLRTLVGNPVGELPAPWASPDLLLDEVRWGSARDDARRLARAIGTTAAEVSSLDLELGVACCAMGRPTEQIALLLQRNDPTREPVETLKIELKHRPDWQAVLRRRCLPRFPLPRALLDSLSGPMDDAQRAFADCLTRPVQGQASSADILRELVGEHAREPEAHGRLAEHYRTLDGASTPDAAIRSRRVVPWLERIHHLGHGGPEQLVALKKITPLSRMSRYELAWSLSVEFKEYELAAQVYRELAEESPEDAYSHHYFAWNLDQAGKELQTVWREYKEAVRLDPENPWYNCRYITFLRDNGFQRDARGAWREALPAVQASNWSRMPRLPEQFQRWVARAALDAGDLVFAREVLGSLQAWEIEASPSLLALQHELEHLSEIERLGEPIYPFSVPMSKRWKDKVILPAIHPAPEGSAARIVAWYPGRVAAVDADAVKLVLADPGQDPPPLSVTEIPRRQMVEMASGTGPEVGRFLELGVYEGERMLVRYHPREANLIQRESFDRSMRYLREDAPKEQP